MPSSWKKPSPKRSPVQLRGAALAGVDPYYLWASLTDWQGMRLDAIGTSAARRKVQIVVHLPEGQDPDAARRRLEASTQGLLSIAPVYRGPIPGGHLPARHLTAFVKHTDLAALIRDHPDLVWTLSQPLRDAERAARASVLGRFGEDRARDSFVAANLLADAVRRQHRSVPRGAQASPPEAVMAVIDFGCPFLNQRFATGPDSLLTRMHAVWDQGAQPLNRSDGRSGESWPWSACTAMGYGREMTAPMLQALFETVRTSTEIDEAQAYRGIDTLIDYDDARRRVRQATHGAHVLDVAGGHSHPLTGQPDRAGQAKLVFVQLPSMTASDSSGASLASHLLDAVRYVLTHCGPETRLVVNISYGCYGGPHDGRSMIEAAFDELLEARRKDFAIVLSAGNSRTKQCHAKRRVRRDQSALLRIDLAAGDTTDSFVQVWYRAVDGWAVRARVRSPNRAWSDWLNPDGAELLLQDSADGGEVSAMLSHHTRVPLHEGGPGSASPKPLSLVLLALAPTAGPLGVSRALSTPGLWELELALHPLPGHGKAPADLVIDAHIERDDPGQNPGASEHRFLDQDYDDELDTLSSLASGRHTLVAGGRRLSDGRQTDYTSVGPRDGKLPMVLAVCEEDEVNPNIAATAVRSGEVYRMKGTSVAAPMLARAVMNRMLQLKEQGRSIAREDWPAELKALVEDPSQQLAWPAPERHAAINMADEPAA